MKKTAIITWITYPNFGTYLQAFALQNFIKSLGYENKILDDAKFIKKYFSWKDEVKKLYWNFSKDYQAYQSSLKKSLKLYNAFKEQYIDLEKNTSDYSHLNSNYDIFICGSDQIWRPYSMNTNPKIDFFYAYFTQKKKISYAPSIGVPFIPNEFHKRYQEYLKDFSHLSAREEQGLKEISRITGKSVVKVVDPTLLLTQDEWDKLLPQQTPKTDNYVLCYLLTPNAAYINAAKKYAELHNLKFKMFFNEKSYYYDSKELISAGPMEFIDTIRNSDFIFTDSFHGSIFASIFKKQFITFKRFKDNALSQNSRVENLLAMFNIPERFIAQENINEIEHLQDIDYSNLQRSLEKYIKQSQEYLIKALSDK